ncbi:MAG: hypothetical protein M3Q27_02050 [Actinomycetota bacterium]|nr:hypothetical protein [Actinomycetota bacterium]
MTGTAARAPLQAHGSLLVAARAVAPRADSSGVPFATARDYLVTLPALLEGVAS